MEQLTNVETLKGWLEKDNDKHDGLLSLIVEGVSLRMENYMGRTFALLEYTSEPVESPGFHAIVVDHGPITNVISVLENTGAITDADFRVEGGRMLVRLSDGVPVPWIAGTVFVTYEAGYEDVPADIEQACVMQCAREYSMSVPGGATLGLKSNSPTQASGESTSYEMKPWLPQVEATMAQYRILL